MIDLLPVEPSLFPFFDALNGPIFSIGKTYKRWEARPRLCSRPRLNSVVLPSKKGNGDDQESVWRTMRESTPIGSVRDGIPIRRTPSYRVDVQMEWSRSRKHSGNAGGTQWHGQLTGKVSKIF